MKTKTETKSNFEANPLIMLPDSYKLSHYQQYPEDTQFIESYIESRGGQFPGTIFFGLQALLKQKLFSTRVTADHVKQGEEFWLSSGLPFNRPGFDRLVNKHGGYWPVSIQAVREGTHVPTGNSLVRVRNTDEEMAWVTSFLEPALLRVWYPTTVATLSFYCKLLIRKWLAKTTDGDVDAILEWMLHDFGLRGASSLESASLGGAAHIVNFRGTDTAAGLALAIDRYGAKLGDARSIAASEHSTITIWGKKGEAQAYRNMLKQFGKQGGIFACVSDSYDLDNAVRNIWGSELRDEVINSGATLVVRPDSGDPATIVVRTLRNLAETFGFTVNSKGYRVLKYVKVIQGDGIDYNSLGLILEAVEKAGFSIENLAFGMGGGLLQKVDRDMQKFAMKASMGKVGGVWRRIFKDPVTDPGKRSKSGSLVLIGGGKKGFKTIEVDPEATKQPDDSAFVDVYRNGDMPNESDFATIRGIAKEEISLLAA